MKLISDFINAVMAGISIAIGGAVFLSVENKAVGAVFFTIGLFAVVTRGLALFTGRVAYLFDNSPKYLISLLAVWLGNLGGAAAAGYLLRLTRIASISEKAVVLCSAKLGDSLLSIFILSAFCNVLIYLAVDGFKNIKHDVGKYIVLFLGVTVFILCGFEHCVANMFYFSIADMWSLKTLVYLIVMTLGNSAGGVFIPLLTKLAVRLSCDKKVM